MDVFLLKKFKKKDNSLPLKTGTLNKDGYYNDKDRFIYKYKIFGTKDGLGTLIEDISDPNDKKFKMMRLLNVVEYTGNKMIFKFEQDAKDLIINLIGVKENKFSQLYLLEETTQYLKGSPLQLTDDRIAKLVERTLYELQVNNKIVCEDGIFVKVNAKKRKSSNYTFSI